MKAIAAYVHPFMLEKVTDALRARKIHGVTVIQCQGFGRRIDGKTPHYEDPAIELGYAPKAKIEIVCQDDETDAIVRTIRENGHTGRPGDGKIFVTEVTRAVDIGRNRDEVIPFEQLSQGAKEQLLLALRAAVAMELSKEEPQILILDDVLVNTDPVRQQRVLDYLQQIAGKVQVLVLTCHPDMYRGVGHSVGLTEG